MDQFGFCMELTTFCVKLVWMLCFCVELVWILNFGFIPTFGLILGLIVGRFYVVFLACFVALIRRILWPVDKGCSGMVSGQNWHVPELPRVSTQLRSPCTPSNIQLRTIITSSSELHFGCSRTLWKTV